MYLLEDLCVVLKIFHLGIWIVYKIVIFDNSCFRSGAELHYFRENKEKIRFSSHSFSKSFLLHAESTLLLQDCMYLIKT